MYQLGDRVIIKDTYDTYKSMRGLHGVVTWQAPRDDSTIYMVATDKPNPHLKGKNWCYVLEDDLLPEQGDGKMNG